MVIFSYSGGSSAVLSARGVWVGLAPSHPVKPFLSVPLPSPCVSPLPSPALLFVGVCLSLPLTLAPLRSPLWLFNHSGILALKPDLGALPPPCLGWRGNAGEGPGRIQTSCSGGNQGKQDRQWAERAGGGDWPAGAGKEVGSHPSRSDPLPRPKGPRILGFEA